MAPKRKLTGAQASLFANICEHYIDAAEQECNDTPDEIPLFSWLSPQQRLKLVSEVMIGVLCENEPLPPNTIQHNATYRALIAILFIELGVEDDMQWDFKDVGEDLLNYDKSADNRTQCLSPEELEERKYKEALVLHRAEKNMNKMKRKDVGEFRVEDSADSIVDYEHLQKLVDSRMKSIFAGGPISIEKRKSIDRLRPLTSDEKSAFRWRRLCDAALQEDFGFPFPLSCVDFDWRCQKMDKWYLAINLLLDMNMMNYGSPTDRALIFGQIDEYYYADPEQLPRIRAIEKHVEILRKIYESTWDPRQMSVDQRCIFAVCSKEAYHGYGHFKWANAFFTNCTKWGIDFKAGGNYQARLDIFRDMKDEYKEGLGFPYGAFHEPDAKASHESWHPKKFRSYHKFEGVHCHGAADTQSEGNLGVCWETKNLKECSRCKVALYCSVKCQRGHWPTHKKYCARLVAERNDKEKIAQMAKDYR